MLQLVTKCFKQKKWMITNIMVPKNMRRKKKHTKKPIDMYDEETELEQQPLMKHQLDMLKEFNKEGITIMDEEEIKALDKIDFPRIIFWNVAQILSARSKLPQSKEQFIELVNSLESNTIFYQDSFYREGLELLNKKYIDIWKRISPGEQKKRETLNNFRLLYTKDKYDILMKLMGRCGLLGNMTWVSKKENLYTHAF